MIVMVDGCKCTIKLVKEWGCNLGEDACMTEEVIDQRVRNIDDELEPVVAHDIDEVGGEVDTLIEDIQREWRDHEAKASAELIKKDGVKDGVEGTKEEDHATVLKVTTMQQSEEGRTQNCSSEHSSKTEKHQQQLQLVAPSTKGDFSKNFQTVVCKKNKKKLSGAFRHSSHNLKRVARMPEKDMMEILKVLKKQAKARKTRLLARSTKPNGTATTNSTKVSSSTSISSVNKD